MLDCSTMDTALGPKILCSLQFSYIENLLEEHTLLHTRDKTAEFILFPKCPLFGGSTVSQPLAHNMVQLSHQIVTYNHNDVPLIFMNISLSKRINLLLCTIYTCIKSLRQVNIPDTTIESLKVLTYCAVCKTSAQTIGPIIRHNFRIRLLEGSKNTHSNCCTLPYLYTCKQMTSVLYLIYYSQCTYL